MSKNTKKTEPTFTGDTNGTDVDVLKAENAALKEALAAQSAQGDQMLDYLADMRADLDAVKAGQMVATAEPVATGVDSKLDAEWEALKEEFKDVPNIAVLERRVVVGVDAPAALRLKAAPGGIPEPTVTEDPHGDRCYWKLRWFNFAIEGRAERFAQEGYLKVDRADLMDPDSIPNLLLTDTHVRKGERGQEVLGKIPRKLFEFKKRRDAHRAGRLMTSESGLKDHVANHVASMAGATGGNADQAGSTVHGKSFSLSIKHGETERVTI